MTADFDKCDITDLLHEKMCRPCPKLDTCHPEGDIFNETQMYICLNQKEITEYPGPVSCDRCHDVIPTGDKIISSDATEDARFCTESCLFEAISQQGEVTTGNTICSSPNALLECPHCHEQGYSETDRWGSEGPFTVPGPDGFTFSIMTCPFCGGIAPLVEDD